eukprot:2974822-Rhodomonas_salina.1
MTTGFGVCEVGLAKALGRPVPGQACRGRMARFGVCEVGLARQSSGQAQAGAGLSLLYGPVAR